MNFGFVGSKAQWQLIQSAFRPGSVHRLVAVVSEPPPGDTSHSTTPFWDNFPPSARSLHDFDELASDQTIDAVILGGPTGMRADRLRTLIMLGRNSVCLHPADVSPLSYHELAMVAADRQLVLIPWLPGRLHPACVELHRICRLGSAGSVRGITIERSGPVGTGPTLVTGSYAELAELVCFLGGDVTEVSSTGDLNGGRLVVHHRLARGAVAEVRLQDSATSSDSWKVAVEFDHGRAELQMADGLDATALLRRMDGHEVNQVTYPAPELATLLLDEFGRAVSGQAHTPSWSNATRAVELADWALYSLERRRAVDVFHEERGELASFKGRMTSLGCGLIWMTLFILIVIAAGKGLELPGMDWLAATTAIVWTLFLVVQALRWTLPKQR